MKRCPTCNRIETDEALGFCRTDGTALVVDSLPLSAGARTSKPGSQSASSEIETSILPHTTNAAVGRGTGPTTVLPAQPPANTSSELTKRKSRNVVVAAVALVILATAVGGYIYYSGKNKSVINSIAVMPFVNESGNAEVEYLSDGMTEALISSLSQVPNLSVKARSTVFRYKGKQTGAKTIGNELGVQAVLNGRVVQRGERLTLSLELIDAQTENVIWSEQYHRIQTDLVSLQSEVARDVSSKLKTRLSAADERKLAKNYTANPEAYRLYLQGRFFWNRRRIGEMGKAIGYFQQAIELDPNYALAYAGLADAVAQPSDVVPHRQRADKARAAALKALSLDNDLAEAHTALAHILTRYDLDFDGAERAIKRASELDPKWVDTYQRYGQLYSILGRHDESIAKLRQGLGIEPFNLPLNTEYGVALMVARRYDEAIAQLKKTLEMDPNFRSAHVVLSTAYGLKGMYAESVKHRVITLELGGLEQFAARIREAFAKNGWSGVLQAEYERLAAAPEKDADRLSYFAEAAFLAALGEKDKAFKALNKSIEARENPSLVFLKVDPRFDPLRDDPRFPELLRRVGFSQ